MKKEYLDYLYTVKFRVAAEIDRLIEDNKSPLDGNCKDCVDTIKTELRMRRNQLISVEDSISLYLKLHSF